MNDTAELHIILAVLALVVGLVVFGLSRSPQTVAYCEVARNGERFHNQIVRVKARLLLDSQAAYIYEDCDPVEALASLIEMANTDVSESSGYVEQLLVQKSESSLKQVDVIIEGRFNAKFSLGCWGPKYHIAVKRAEQLGPVSDYQPMRSSEEGLRMKH